MIVETRNQNRNSIKCTALTYSSLQYIQYLYTVSIYIFWHLNTKTPSQTHYRSDPEKCVLLPRVHQLPSGARLTERTRFHSVPLGDTSTLPAGHIAKDSGSNGQKTKKHTNTWALKWLIGDTHKLTAVCYTPSPEENPKGHVHSHTGMDPKCEKESRIIIIDDYIKQ